MAASAGKSGTRRPAAAAKSGARAQQPDPAVTSDPRLGPGFEVLRLTPSEAPEPARARIFSITRDGKETWYTVNVEPDWRTGLEYSHLIRTIGVGLAMDWLLDEMLGADGYAALRSHEGLTPKEIGTIVRAVERLALGALELPKES